MIPDYVLAWLKANEFDFTYGHHIQVFTRGIEKIRIDQAGYLRYFTGEENRYIDHEFKFKIPRSNELFNDLLEILLPESIRTYEDYGK